MSEESFRKKVQEDIQNGTISGRTNFCRVFLLPEEEDFSSEYCFGGGHPTNFQMVDWFNPIPTMLPEKEMNDWWDDRSNILGMVDFVKSKNYIIKGRAYLILTTFGASISFRKDIE